MKSEQMQPEHWRRIEQLYHAVLERAASERAAFLADACADNESLRDEVESLLRCDARAKHFIEAPALEVAAQLHAADQSPSMIGRQISHYQILSLLGAGGMGEVYLAQDTSLRRKVALTREAVFGNCRQARADAASALTMVRDQVTLL